MKPSLVESLKNNIIEYLLNFGRLTQPRTRGLKFDVNYFKNYKLKAVTDNTSHEIKDLVLFLENLQANSEKEPSMDNASTFHKLKVAFDEVFIDIRENRIDKRSNLKIMAHNMFRNNLNVYYYLLKTIASVETPDLEAIKERLSWGLEQYNPMQKSELDMTEL